MLNLNCSLKFKLVYGIQVIKCSEFFGDFWPFFHLYILVTILCKILIQFWKEWEISRTNTSHGTTSKIIYDGSSSRFSLKLKDDPIDNQKDILEGQDGVLSLPYFIWLSTLTQPI